MKKKQFIFSPSHQLPSILFIRMKLKQKKMSLAYVAFIRSSNILPWIELNFFFLSSSLFGNIDIHFFLYFLSCFCLSKQTVRGPLEMINISWKNYMYQGLKWLSSCGIQIWWAYKSTYNNFNFSQFNATTKFKKWSY